MPAEHGNQPTTESALCPICHGVGYVRLKVPAEDPRFGKAIPCVCKRQELKQRHLADLRHASNLAHLKAMTFDTFRVERATNPELVFALTDALNTAQEFAAKPKGWLLIIGPYGCGKTHLAAAIANACIEREVPLLFVVVPDLLDYLRAAYAPDSPVSYDQRFEQVRNIDLLILDDLGTQNATPWAAEKLYQLLNYRYLAELPTVITTNLQSSEMDPRLASRLRDPDHVRNLPIYASDYRAKGKDESFGSLSLYGGFNFETFSDRQDELEPAQSAHLREAIRTVQAYAEAPKNWLLLRGGYGVGKTHLAAAIANKVATSGTRVVFVVVSDLLDHLRATYQPGSPVSYDRRSNEVRRAWLLVLDDLGVQNATPWAQEKLFQILNYRYLSGLPTVITVSSDDWHRLDARLQSRLQDASVCTMIDIDAPSYRGSATQPKQVRRTTRRRL
jgi:DNA replication protein DnaC